MSKQFHFSRFIILYRTLQIHRKSQPQNKGFCILSNPKFTYLLFFSILTIFSLSLSVQLQSVDETLREVRDQLSRSGVVNSDLAVPLFDALLRVSLAQVRPSPDAPEEKPERVSLEWTKANVNRFVYLFVCL